jgi:DNA helicase-2/ATP-dependent DNA helicase PcrA
MIGTTTLTAELSVPGLEGDDEGVRIVREELKLLQTVERALEHARKEAAARGKPTEDDARLLELREDVSVAKPEDLPALFEQMHTLGAIRAQRGKSTAGSIDEKSPYFGHLRLEEMFEGEKKARRRDVLIGSRSYVDPTAGIRIVDWRQAPVSRVFYRYREDDDYEEVLGHKLVEGKVLARRSVAIVHGQLRRVSCPAGTFICGQDGQWRRADQHSVKLIPGQAPRLGIGADGLVRTDKLLPAIASMLDPSQFDLITKPGPGVIAIQGSAGSGKTTVGLHRVAYLHATDPSRYRGDRMLVMVPSEALIHYTGRVLPSLGVDDVPVTTFARFAKRAVFTLFPKLPSRVSAETPSVVSRMKSHALMLREIDALGARITSEVDTRLRTAMGKWPSGELVVKAWEATKAALGSPTVAPDSRLTMLAQYVAGKRTMKDVEPPAKIPEVTKTALTELGQELRKKTRAILDAWDELVTDHARLTKTFQGVQGLGPAQITQAAEWCVKQARVRGEGERDGEEPSLDAEDHALLLRLFQVLRGPLVDGDNMPVRVNHLFIDEVQDMSPVELRTIVDVAGNEPSVTLSGDVAQRMLQDDDHDGGHTWSALLADAQIAEEAGGLLEPLKVSYRSTAEITGFARGVLGPFAHEAEPIATRHGPPVESFPFASPGEAVAFLADALKELALTEPNANVAVLARFGPQADVYEEGLRRAEVPNVRRVKHQDFTWEPGVDVTDVRQTKGLEFDEVVLVDTNKTSYPDSPQARHALYVGATRAAHQLWCVSSDDPSTLLGEGLASQERFAKNDAP